MDQILPELLKVGGPAALVAVLYYLLATGKLVVGKVYDREVERGDRLEASLDRVTRALENITSSENLAVALLKSVEKKAAENDAREGGDES